MQVAEPDLLWVIAKPETPVSGHAIRLAVNKKAVQMRVVPAHHDLESVMQIGQALVARHEHAPPDRWADFQEENVKLVDFSRILFFRQCLFPFLISSAWKLLDTFLQLLATGQRIAHGGHKSRRTIFGLMAHIDRDFFQRDQPAARARWAKS
jgi:hypothetical protein